MIPKVTKVVDLKTGECVAFYMLPPRLAVISAYAQYEKEDWETDLYEEKYGEMVTEGEYTVACGDYTTLTKEKGYYYD